MRRLRQSVAVRLCAAGLLASLGLGLAAPVVAGRPAEAALRLAFDVIPQEVLDDALVRAAGMAASEAGSPEAFAGAFATALRDALGDGAPSAEAVLDALYGQLFRVLQEEHGGCAVVVAQGVALGVPAASASESARPQAHRPGPIAVSLPAWPPQRPAPRSLRPAIQPLGP
jgi:hypothetical protein